MLSTFGARARDARTARFAATLRGGLLVLLVGCAPDVDGPLARQRMADHEDGEHLATQLAMLPGAVRASATVHRSARDPLAVTPPSPASAAVLLVVDDRADRPAISRSATALVHAAVPEVASPLVIVEVGAIRPVLAKVGPFTVEAKSRSLLRVTLIGALAMIAALAAWIAVVQRRGNSDQ